MGQVERWQRAAGAIEAYRTRWNIDESATLGPEPADPKQRAHWAKTVALVGTAGFLIAGDRGKRESELASLSRWWENLHTADRQRDQEISIERPRVSSPASRWTDEPDRDVGFDVGFGL